VNLWHMASAMPDLRLPSQLQSITSHWPAPNFTAWWQENKRMNNLPGVITQPRPGPGVEPATAWSQVLTPNQFYNCATHNWGCQLTQADLFNGRKMAVCCVHISRVQMCQLVKCDCLECWSIFGHVLPVSDVGDSKNGPSVFWERVHHFIDRSCKWLYQEPRLKIESITLKTVADSGNWQGSAEY